MSALDIGCIESRELGLYEEFTEGWEVSVVGILLEWISWNESLGMNLSERISRNGSECNCISRNGSECKSMYLEERRRAVVDEVARARG
jgi:hypothetical protein